MPTTNLPKPENFKTLGVKGVICRLIAKLINRTTAMFTVITLLICFFGSMQNKNVIIDCRSCGSVAGEFPGGMLNSSVLLWFAVFSFLIAVISSIADFMKNKNVNHVITMCLHFALSYISFFFIFIKGQLFTLYSDSILFTGRGSWITGIALTLLFIGAYIVVFGTKFLWYIIYDKIKVKKAEKEHIDVEASENESEEN